MSGEYNLTWGGRIQTWGGRIQLREENSRKKEKTEKGKRGEKGKEKVSFISSFPNFAFSFKGREESYNNNQGK